MLQEYKKKRDFGITPEPSGLNSPRHRKKQAQALSFVIQKHDATRLHYDFRLEIDGVMVSWAVPKGPSLNPAGKRLAVMTEDHPMEYSNFEGIIPARQYGAGEVIIWDHGTYLPDDEDKLPWNKEDANKRMREGLKKGKLSFHLKGEKLKGSWALVRLHNKGKEWLLIKHKDEFASISTDILKQNASVVSGLTIEAMQQNGATRIWTSNKAKKANPKTTGKSTKRHLSVVASTKQEERKEKNGDKTIKQLLNGCQKSKFPKDVLPMLATLVDEPFTVEGWFFEPKLDGIRAIAYVKDRMCRLVSRRGNDLSEKYPEICKNLSNQNGQLVLDGEVVALGSDGKPSFQHLQQSSKGLRSFGEKDAPTDVLLLYYAFDILHANGHDITELPIEERKTILTALLKPNNKIRLVQSLGSDGITAFKACWENGLEGIIAKRTNSTYEAGIRSRSWLKIKTTLSQEFLICGFTEGTGSRTRTFGSLLLGEYDTNGILHFVGGVGTGFNNKLLNFLSKKMKPLITPKCPFKEKLSGRLNPTWLKPKLVAEVKYAERTQDDMLRVPVFMHLRDDIDPLKVTKVKSLHVQSTQDLSLLASAKQKNTSKNKMVESEVSTILEQLDNKTENLTLEVKGNKLPLTHLNKIFWPAHNKQPAITKRNYLQYLTQISPYVIPHLADRLLTLVRFPNGISGTKFYQKHWTQQLPEFIGKVSVFTEEENKNQDFLVCNNLATLLWLGQIADLELHSSHTRVNQEPDAYHLSTNMTGSLEELKASIGNYPDYIVFDLDPFYIVEENKKELNRNSTKRDLSTAAKCPIS